MKHKLKFAVLCCVFIFGATFGMPMSPEKIRETLEQLNKPKVAQTLPSKDDDGDELEKYLRRHKLR